MTLELRQIGKVMPKTKWLLISDKVYCVLERGAGGDTAGGPYT